MQLVERHVIDRQHKHWQECDKLAFLSKNLWNAANYICRQHFFANGAKLDFNSLYHATKNLVDYQVLPTKVSKQIIRRLEQAWTSFIKAKKAYYKNPSKFVGKARIPGYKHKTKGRNILPYPGKESIAKKLLARGICKLSMSNIEFPTKALNIAEVRIIPSSCCYVIEVVYTRHKPQHTKNTGVAGVDLGLNNLMAVTTNQPGVKPLLVTGKPLKAINTFYNKRRAQYQSVEATTKIKQITHKRNCRVDNYLHTSTRRVIDWCVSNSVGTLIIGKNDGIKNGIKLGKKNNQQFVNIPHTTLVGMLTYKAELVGIKVVVTEESYTSKASALDNDEIPVYAQVKKEPKFSGYRVKRGLYRTAKKQLINADVNGSMNIIRKVISNAFSQGIKALPFMPLVVDPLRTQKHTYLLTQAFQAVV